MTAWKADLLQPELCSDLKDGRTDRQEDSVDINPEAREARVRMTSLLLVPVPFLWMSYFRPRTLKGGRSDWRNTKIAARFFFLLSVL